MTWHVAITTPITGGHVPRVAQHIPVRDVHQTVLAVGVAASGVFVGGCTEARCTEDKVHSQCQSHKTCRCTQRVDVHVMPHPNPARTHQPLSCVAAGIPT
jgi:homoaconitase/3-isopropylmalate dehydratase large subunit